MIRCDQQRITERIWLRAFGTPPKFPFRSFRYARGVRRNCLWQLNSRGGSNEEKEKH